jgi:hypothetical protein
MRLARLSGGVTFQPIYTFSDQVRAFADSFRSDLLGSSFRPGWFAKGFQVDVDDEATVRIRHLEHARWHGLVSDTSVFFQYDIPPEDTGTDILHVQAGLLMKVVERLQVGALNSVGTKFTALAHAKEGVPIIDQVQQLLGLDPAGTLLQGRTTATTDVSFRIGYRMPIGAASLQVSSEATRDAYSIDLDCYSWDTLALDWEYLAFTTGAYEHYCADVQSYLAPLEKCDRAVEVSERD